MVFNNKQKLLAMKTKLVAFFFTLGCCISSAQTVTDYMTLTGTVLDQASKEPLPFTGIGITHSNIGTSANESGNFSVRIPVSLRNEKLRFVFLGYEEKEIDIKEAVSPLVVLLISKPVQLSEVVVSPLAPTEYLRQAVANIAANYNEDAYYSTLYIAERGTENGIYHLNNEALAKVYHPGNKTDKKDSLQISIINARSAGDVRPMQFLKRKVEKRKEKEIKRAAKKGEAFDDDAYDIGPVTMSVSPYEILNELSISAKEIPHFMQEKNFSNYDYKLIEGTIYQGREMLVIRFEQKMSVKDMLMDGDIYLDAENYAVVALKAGFSKAAQKQTMNGMLKAALFLMGYKLEFPKTRFQSFYKWYEGRWYFSHAQYYLDVYIEKRKMFKDNEKARLKFSNEIAVIDIKLDKPATPFSKDKVLGTDQKIKTFNKFYDPEIWKGYNVIAPKDFAQVK
jgi:hypothetical protein